MRTFTKEELADIINKHSAWLRGEDMGVKADLSSANLRSANLRSANLRSADLSSANLRSADLSSADLSSADLRSADLSSANLRSADLRSADLSSANLRSADLSSANLSYADLSSANLRSANLSYANIRSANLSYALNNELAMAQTSITPDGDLIGWKKCKNDVIVKLEIPAKAKRSNSTGRKCRAEFAKVLQIFGADEAVSHYDDTVVYRKGETINCHKWDENRWEECSGGIHFFLTRVEAENY